jgi:AcrR family transcriptional regulator
MSRPPTATREDQLSETRERLLIAAAEEFADLGFDSANINRISQAAGFAKGTIYNYFPSKRDLMLALIDEIGANHVSFILSKTKNENDPKTQIETFFRAGFEFIHQFPFQARVAINTVYGHDAEFKKRIFDAYTDLFKHLIDDIIGDGMVQGEFKHLDPDFCAGYLMSLYLGATSLADSEGRVSFRPEQVAALVLNGLRQPEVQAITEEQEYG